MRTIRCEYKFQVDATSELNVQTEVIIDQDAEAEQAGRDALRVIYEFRQGIIDQAEEMT